MSTRKTGSTVAQIVESEKELTGVVAQVEEYYFALIGKSDIEFTVKDRLAIRNAIKNFGVGSVLEAIPTCIELYGEEALSKLNGILTHRCNPKARDRYICGIIKNKLHQNYVDKSSQSQIKELVSTIVDHDNGEAGAIDYIVEEMKAYNLLSTKEYISLMIDLANKYFDEKNKPPK